HPSCPRATDARRPRRCVQSQVFFIKHPPAPGIHTLSLHDALPISATRSWAYQVRHEVTWCATPATSVPTSGTAAVPSGTRANSRSEEHTSELQSPCNLVCRLLLEKKTRTRSR